jgi:hypothetical protein
MATFVTTLKTADAAVIFEGLPHQYHQPALLKDEIARKKSVELFGFHFYAAPTELNQESRRKVFALLQEGSWFKPRPEEVHFVKKCGGFHPDYQLEWRAGGKVYQIQFCLGCEETKAFAENQYVFGDVEDREGLYAWLRGFKKLRPANRVPWFFDPETSARQLAQLREGLKQFAGAEVTVWEGLPARREQAAWKTESASKKNIDIHGYHYYEAEYRLSAEQRDRFSAILASKGALQATAKSEQTYFPFGDFLLRWKTGDSEFETQVEFDRQEIHYYWGDHYGYASLSKEALTDLKKLLAPFQKQRPPRTREDD